VEEFREEATKRRTTKRFNTKVKMKSFCQLNLVWCMRTKARKNLVQGKIAPNRESPFRVIKNLQNGAYRLEHLDGREIPGTWNTSHLKFISAKLMFTQPLA